MTNYDRIKNMSVTEMTAFIIKLAFFSYELCEREHNASCLKKIKGGEPE